MLKSVAPALLVAVALAGAAEAQGTTGFDGQYVGQLRLLKVKSGDCTQPPPGALYPLRVASGRVEFKYVPRFDTTLVGMVAQDGTFHAARRLRNGIVRMQGRIEAGAVSAVISSPSCRYSFQTAN